MGTKKKMVPVAILGEKTKQNNVKKKKEEEEESLYFL